MGSQKTGHNGANTGESLKIGKHVLQVQGELSKLFKKIKLRNSMEFFSKKKLFYFLYLFLNYQK